MGGITAQEQVGKRCYKNQTAGYQSVVKLDHLGAQAGTPVEPYGTVWLTEEEAILTARAPALAKDNPFVEQPFQFEDQSGQRVERMMAPLVLVPDEEGSESDRFVPYDGPAPAHDINLHSMAANQRTTEAALDADSDRPVPTEETEPQLAPSSAAAVPPSHARASGVIDPSQPLPPEEDQRESWVENDERTEEPQEGALGGSNEKVGPTDEDPAKVRGPGGPPPQQPAPHAHPQAPTGSADPTQADVPTQRTVPSESAGVQKGAGAPSEQGAAEEHAGVTERGEETGAADTPVGKAPEGEFASKEEVGSPEAPTQGAPSGEGS